MLRSPLLGSSVSRCSLAVVSPSCQPVRRLFRPPVCPSRRRRRTPTARMFSPTTRKCRSRAGWKEPRPLRWASVSVCLNRGHGQRHAPGSLHRRNPALREHHEQDLDRHLRVHCGQWRHAHRWLYRTSHPDGPRRSLRCRNRDDHRGYRSVRRRHREVYRRALVQPGNRLDHGFLRGDYLLARCRHALKLDRHRQQHGVEAAKKLNVIQPVSPPPEGGEVR